ncbi:MAG: SgcJ/EcaC family oxidoreductase [Jatrophihabitans sp.]
MTTTEAQKQEEDAVHAVVEGVHTAWTNGDPDAFVADYAENASAVLPGSYMPSRAAIHGTMSFLFNGPLKGTRASDKVLDIRFLNDEAAVVVTETGVLIPGESEAPPERTVYATWVLAKNDGKWQIAAYCNSPTVAPPAPGQ